jgi:hypothetical protein
MVTLLAGSPTLELDEASGGPLRCRDATGRTCMMRSQNVPEKRIFAYFETDEEQAAP